MTSRNHFILPLLLSLAPLAAQAASIDSAASGNWNATAAWVGATVPQTGVGDTANILSGHTIIYTGGAGLDGSAELGTGAGNTININGGVLSQSATGSVVRIGHKADGTLNINDGRFHITDGAGDGGNNVDRLAVGVETGGRGFINIGDGIGAAGSAVLNLRDRVDGAANVGGYSTNLGNTANTAGTITINSDGILEGDQRTWNGNAAAQDPHIRIGQESSGQQSLLKVNAGGKFNARGHVEVAAQAGSNGLLHLSGSGARMDMTDGSLTVGYTGNGSMVVENNAVFQRVNTTAGRLDLFLGRNAAGVGTLTIQSGGQFRREAGANVGDLRIGLNGSGTVTVETGGLLHNNSGNWDWVGQNTGSTGLLHVNGGTYEILSASNLNVGQEGTGTFRQTSGTTNINSIFLSEGNGAGNFELRGGTATVRSSFFMGGSSSTPVRAGSGSSFGNQTGGILNVGGAFVIGLRAGHAGTYNLLGGTINHTGSDTSVGESGSGIMTISAGATLNETTAGTLFVGRENGSSGILTVNGTLSKTGSTNAIRVGNGTGANENTTGTGLLGGTGSITSAGGVTIGQRGIITGGLNTTVGTLSITGNLNFRANGTLFVNFDGAGNSDLINLTGSVNVTGAILDGDWIAGGPTGILSRYWLIENDGVDPISGTFANTGAGSATAISLYPSASSFITIDSQEFAIFYSADKASDSLTGGNDLLLSAVVPEPTAVTLLLAATALCHTRRRRPGGI